MRLLLLPDARCIRADLRALIESTSNEAPQILHNIHNLPQSGMFPSIILESEYESVCVFR